MNKKVHRKIKSLPLSERPREKMMKLGTNALSDSELLAIILQSGTRENSAVDLAYHLISYFGNISELLKVTVEELCTFSGIGPAKAVKIKASLELAQRCVNKEILTKEKITTPEDVYQLLKFRFQSEDREHFALILLNSKHCLLKIELVSIGSLNTTIVHPREVFQRAIRAASSSLILVHNHPSGNPTPSQDDIDITHRLIKAGELLGIQVLDHVIIGEGEFFSFSRENML